MVCLLTKKEGSLSFPVGLGMIGWQAEGQSSFLFHTCSQGRSLFSACFHHHRYYLLCSMVKLSWSCQEYLRESYELLWMICGLYCFGIIMNFAEVTGNWCHLNLRKGNWRCSHIKWFEISPVETAMCRRHWIFSEVFWQWQWQIFIYSRRNLQKTLAQSYYPTAQKQRK